MKKKKLTKIKDGKLTGTWTELGEWRAIVPVICARKGSSLKDKNLREYNGSPLLKSAIERTIAAFGKCYVMTDSEYYSDCARAWGAIVPYVDANVEDFSIVSDQLFRFVDRMELYADEDFGNTLLALIQCTSPNTSVETLVETTRVAAERIPALENYFNFGFVAASAYELPNKENAIFADVMAGEGVYGQQASTAPIDTPRQKLRKLYGLTGGIFIVPARQVFQRGRVGISVFSGFSSHTSRFFFHVAPMSEALDIDRAEDFLRK